MNYDEWLLRKISADEHTENDNLIAKLYKKQMLKSSGKNDRYGFALLPESDKQNYLDRTGGDVEKAQILYERDVENGPIGPLDEEEDQFDQIVEIGSSHKAIKSSTYQFICEFDGKYAPRVLTYIGKDGVCGWGDYEEKSDDALSVSESELKKAVEAIVKNEDYDDIEIVKDNGDSVFVKEYLNAGSFDAAWKKAIEDEENEWKINSSRKSEASAWVKNAIKKDRLFDNISKLCSDLKAYPEDKLPPNGLYCKLISCKMELDGSSKLEAEKMCSSFTILNWMDHLDDLLKNF